MATFKVGQRVKVIAISPGDWGTKCRVGDEGIVVAPRYPMKFGHEWCVYIERLQHEYEFYSYELAPLTDPKADEFIERIKKMKVYDEPTVKPRVTVQ